MRIFLVSANTAESPYPVYPLGMGIVAHALMRAGHSVRQFDFLQAGRSCEQLRAALQEASPELVGISVRNIDNVNLVHEQRYLSVVRDIVREIRSVTGVPVLLGGSGFSVMPEAVLEAVQADYGIVGESERAVVDFVERLSRGQTPQERCVRPSGVLPGDDISPACYDPRIMQFYLGRGNMAPIQTKRGCTYRCVYCTYPLLEGPTLRPRPAVDVVDDIGHLVNEHKAGYIFFTDSVFNDDRGHYRDILNEMKRRRLSVSWTAFIKPGRLTDSDVLLMKQTGLKAVELGSDAASDTALEGMGKDFLFSDVIAANEIFTRHGIATAHYFMFGGPGETRGSVTEGIRNITHLSGTVAFMFMGVRILPGTPLERIAVREGIIPGNAGLLDPVYYISPALDKAWLEKTLLEGFRGHRHCVFPADKFESSLKFLHQMGYAGSLWEMLLQKKSRGPRRGKKTHV